MSERDAIAQTFFDIAEHVDADDAEHARRLYFASSDKTLYSFVRDSMTSHSTSEEATKHMADFLVHFAARDNFNAADMQQIMRLCEDRVADEFGLQTGRAE